MQLQQFLSFFGTPLVKALPEFDAFQGYKSEFKWFNHHSLDVLLELNKEKPFALVFTPNGNYGIQNTKGKLQTKKENATSPYINALCFDIDIKTHPIKDKQKLYEHMLDTCTTYRFQPTFIVETPGGFHIYMVIKEEDREDVWKMYGEKTFELSTYISKIMGSDDNARCSTNVNGLLRLPTSNHWKSGSPKETTIKFFNEKALLTREHIDAAIKYMSDGTAIDLIEKAAYKLSSTRYAQANNVPICEVIQALSKFPRVYNGRAHIFVLDNLAINIYYTSGATTEKTNGYKVNKNTNYVNCFSSEYHPIEERPRGGPYAFVLKYFFGDKNKTAKFFEEFFGVKVSETPIIDEVQTMSIEKDDYSVIFTNKRISIVKMVETKNGANTVKKDIFRTNIEILGKTKIFVNGDFSDTETPNIAYLVKIGGNEMLMHRHTNKKKFNDRYGTQVFFYGEDNDLGLFYEAMDVSPVIKEIETITTNGIYDGTTVLGGKVVSGSTSGKYICTNTKYDTRLGGEVRTLKSMLDKLREAYDDTVIVPAFLQVLALAGMNMWDFCNTLPGLLLTGKTGCGKTTLIDVLKSIVGYAEKDRKYTVSAVTKQPLAQYASDGSILFLDELTGNVPRAAEELLRTIINRDKGGRGMAGGNIFYNFRAPLCISGERTFVDESINNRFLCVTMNQKYWKKGGKVALDSCRGFTCIDEVYTKYYQYEKELPRLYAKYVAQLMGTIKQSRTADTWAYIFVMNEIYGFGFTFDELLHMANYQLSLMGFTDNQSISEDGNLELFLVRGLYKKELILKEDISDSSETYRFIFVNDEYYQTNRSKLNFMVAQLNDRYDGGNVYLNSSFLTVKINKKCASEFDFFLEIIIDNVNRITSSSSKSTKYY